MEDTLFTSRQQDLPATAQALLRQAGMKRLYQEVFPTVARYIGRRGGSFETARDLFQDALVVYYEKTRDKNFVPEQNEKAYILGIVKNTWLKKQERESRFSTHFPAAKKEISDDPSPAVSSSRLLYFLERSGKKCMELLQAVYYEKTSMKDMAGRFGFSGERSATVQKHKCLEKVRDAIKEKSLIYEDFYE